MNFLKIDRNDGGSWPVNVSDTDGAIDLSAMDLEAVIEWYGGGNLSCTIANGRLEEDATTPLSAGQVNLVLTDTETSMLPTGYMPFLTLRDVTSGAKETIIERLAIKVL